MSPDAYIPIWNKGINFKVYQTIQTLNFEQLDTCIQPYQANVSRKKGGWQASEPYYLSSDKKFACLGYLNFKKNSNATKLQGRQIYESDGAGIMFDFDNKIIIPTTTSSQKLANIVDRKAFEAIRDFTDIHGFEYTGDFLFWLAYMHMTNQKDITENIRIQDIINISSGRETANLIDSVRTPTDVTRHTESQVILGLSGVINSFYTSIHFGNKDYDFKLFSDGRIQAGFIDELEELPDKYAYAKKIHDLLQNCYTKYSQF